MSNQLICEPYKASQNFQLKTSPCNYNRCTLPAINTNPSFCKPSMMHSAVPKTSTPCSNRYLNPPTMNCNNRTKNISSISNLCQSSKPSICNIQTHSYDNCKTNCSPGIDVTLTPCKANVCNDTQQVPTSKNGICKSINDYNKMDIDANKTTSVNQNNNSNICSQRFMASNLSDFNCATTEKHVCTGKKTVVRDRCLANEILQRAGIPANVTPHDCFEVITDTPITCNDNVNCDPSPLCMRKPVDCQECYEQPVVVRHLKPPQPPVPPPIIIRERCAPLPSPQPPIVIRQIPPRPATPPPLIIRECPPSVPPIQEPTIIEREIPPPPPPPRQVIVERLPTPPPKPRPIILEKWLPYEEPQDRPCIVEKATINEMPPTKNVIIQYEAPEPKIQSHCINEGISCVDPKQLVNEKSNENGEVFYVDQINNLPDHIKCQLSPQALAAIGIQYSNKENMSSSNSCVVRTNPPCLYKQPANVACPSTHHASSPRAPIYRQQQPCNRILSTSTVGLPHCLNKYNASKLSRPNNQCLTNFTRTNYNPWATTYQVSYTNKARSVCRTR